MPFVQLASIRIHYLEEGSGDPLVWLPGGNDCAALMMHAHRRLAERYRLICVDPRGQGQSDPRTTPEDYAPSEYVADLVGVLDALGVERPIVGGHSRGGRTSVELALRHPGRPRAVIAAGSPLGGYTERRGSRLRDYQRVLREQSLDEFLDFVNTGPRNPERHAIWRAAAHHAGAEALIAQYEALTRLPSLLDKMPSLQCPALFISGDRDGIAGLLKEAAEAAPPARYVEVPNAGHALFADNPDGYFAGLNAFLDELP